MELFMSQDINWWTGVMWIIVMYLSAVWSLILMAPIHCSGSIDEQVDVMLKFSKSVLIKKHTHLHLGWPESEYIFSQFKFLTKLIL